MGWFCLRTTGPTHSPPSGAPHEKRAIQTWPPASQPLKAWARAPELGGGVPQKHSQDPTASKSGETCVPETSSTFSCRLSHGFTAETYPEPQTVWSVGAQPICTCVSQHQKWGAGGEAGQELQTWLSLLQRPTSIKWVAEKVLKRHGARSKQPRRPEIAFKHLPSPRSCYLGGINTSAMF